MSEAAFQKQITDLAERLRWGWLHVPPSQAQSGSWHTAASGTLRKGWPDLVLVRDRVIFAELKKTGGRVSLDQVPVHRALTGAGAEFYIWHPEQFDMIQEILR
jgi:hypothetical protein